MRHILHIALAAVCVALIACGSGGSTPTTPMEKAEVNVAEVKEKRPGPWANICHAWFNYDESQQAMLISKAGFGELKYQEIEPAVMAEAISAACGEEE